VKFVKVVYMMYIPF